MQTAEIADQSAGQNYHLFPSFNKHERAMLGKIKKDIIVQKRFSKCRSISDNRNVKQVLGGISQSTLEQLPKSIYFKAQQSHLRANRKKFGHLKFTKKVDSVSNNSSLDMRKFLSTSVKRIASYSTGQQENYSTPYTQEQTSVDGQKSLNLLKSTSEMFKQR